MRILCVGHDGRPTGAPIVLESFQRFLTTQPGVRVATCLARGGPLVAAYRRCGPTAVVARGRWTSHAVRSPRLRDLLARVSTTWLRLRLGRPDIVFVNTLATRGVEAPAVGLHGVRVVVYVHELGGVIDALDARPIERTIAASDLVIVPSRAVHEQIRDRFGVDDARLATVREGIDIDVQLAAPPATSLREQLSIPASAFVVVGCGTVDWRKGPDLFVQTALRLLRGRAPDARPVHFVWMGGGGIRLRDLRADIDRMGLCGLVHFVPSTDDARLHFPEFDVLAMTSREDSYPLVMLEAGAAGLPTVAFEGSGGAPEFVGTDAGVCVPYGDAAAMARAIESLVDDPELLAQSGAVAHERALLHDRVTTGRELLELLEALVPPR